jgi:hypothetical protein
MKPRSATQPTMRQAHCRPSGESGMALFIVLVLVLVLTVVITQMVFVTQVEKRISKNRQGFVHLNYALQASSRLVMQKVSEDLMEDLGLLEELDPEGGDSLGGIPAPSGGENSSGAGRGPSADGENSNESNTDTNDAVDTRHDVWAYPIQDTVNDVQVTGEIVDGESCIDLNHIFELVYYEEDEEEAGEGGDLPDLGDLGVPVGAGAGTEAGAGEVSINTGDSFPVTGFTEEEFFMPEQEQVDDAEYMLQRLIEGVVDFNQENGFNYEDTPDPVDAAAAIVGYVFQRISDEKTRRIRSLDSILQLEEISLELFEGPADPMAEEQEEMEEEEGLASGLGSGMGLEDLPGIGSLDFLEQSGYSLLDEMVEGPITPLGLRHVLTANSSGKINLNTARPEVILALIPSFEDFEEAKDIAWQIYQRGDTFRELSEEEEAAMAEMPLGEDEEDMAQDFEHFTNINQLSQINEDWNSAEVGGEESITDLLKEDLEQNVVFKSQYFTANLKGTKDNQTLSGKLVCARRDRHVVILSWRELKR